MAFSNKVKEIPREKLNRAIEEYLKEGGRINRLPPERSWDPQSPARSRGIQYHYTHGEGAIVKGVHI